MAKGIIVGFLCFLLFLSHIFVFHRFEIKRRFYFIARMFLLGLFFYIALFAMIPEEQVVNFISVLMPLSIIAFLNGAFLHFFFGYFYLHMIQVMDRSPATRIMVEIESSPGKRLTQGEIKRLYSIERKISDELEDMLILGRARKDGAGHYRLTYKGRIHMGVFRFVRDYLRLRRN